MASPPHDNRGRRRLPAWILLALGLLLAAAAFRRVEKDMVDFEVNRTAGRRLIVGETLYRTADEHYQFKYPPFAALLYVPFALLPPTAAKAAWYALVLIAMGAIFVLTSRLASPGRAARVVGGLVLARYFLREIQLGQINALLTAGLLLMLTLLFGRVSGPPPRFGREGAAGLAWGLVSGIKPYSLIFLPYYAIKKRVAALGGGAAVLAAAFLLPASYYGWRGNLAVHGEWASSLSRSTPPLLASQDNVSLLGLLSKWTGDPGISSIAYAAALVLLMAFVLWFVLRGRNLPRAGVLDGFLLLLLIPLISPLGWDYTFLSAAPAVILLLDRWRVFPCPVRWFLGLDLAVIALSLYDVLGRSLYARFMSLSLITVCFLALVPCLGYLRIRRQA
jgi:alpha-1,2-mannosyltransferase